MPLPNYVDVVAIIQETNCKKAVAFAMALHGRLGSGSMAQQLTLDCVRMVLLSYYSLGSDYSNTPDGKDILKYINPCFLYLGYSFIDGL
jgi:hypothetical protein